MGMDEYKKPAGTMKRKARKEHKTKMLRGHHKRKKKKRAEDDD